MSAEFVFCLLLGLVPLGIGLAQLVMSRRQRRWITTTGTIIESHVTRPLGEVGRGNYAIVRYEYVFDGRRHESDRRSLDNFDLGDDMGNPALFRPPSSPHGIVDRYPLDKEVTVHLDPRHPSRSVLELGHSWATYIWISVGLFYTVVVLLASYLA